MPMRWRGTGRGGVPVRLRAAVLILAAAGCGLTLGAGPVGTTSTTLPTGNLIVNPGAEAGPGATGDGIVAIPGWTTTSNFTAVQYGGTEVGGSFPDAAASAAIGGGKNFFSGGPNN